MSKQQKDIEELLRWAYLDELPKRKLSSAEGVWDGIAEYGARGGVDVGHGAAQRYPHFGLPHPDAEVIERTVGALPRRTVDWARDYDRIVAELGALVHINALLAPAQAWRSTSAGDSGAPNKTRRAGKIARAPDGRGVRATPADAPRDVILVNTINVAALVTTHAIRGTRPDWRSEPLRALAVPAARGRGFAVVGECRGKNLYTTGSYCPLRWEPSPIEVIQARADYVVWHDGLIALSRTLQLRDHVALSPSASPAPWIEPEIEGHRWVQGPVRARPLPLKPARKAPLPPSKKTRYSKVRRAALDRGQKLDTLTTPAKGS